MAESVTRLTDTFYEITGNKLGNLSQLRLFTILQDLDLTKYMNIWRTYSLNEAVTSDTLFFETYEAENDDWWDNISSQIYGTPNLWWVAALMNGIENPFEDLDVGDNIKILRDPYIYQLIKEIEAIQDL